MHCEKCGSGLSLCTISEHGRSLQREKCLTCGYIRYNNPVPVVQCIVERGDGHVLLARNLDWPENFFGLVSGFLEAREQPAVGMCRELEEEINLHVVPSDLTLVGVATFERMNQIIVLYHLPLPVDAEVKANLEELAAIKWVPLTRLKFRWSEGAGPLLRDWLTQRLKKAKL